MSKKTKNGSKRWVKSSSNKCDLLLFYKKKFGGTFIHGYGNQYIVKVGKVSNDKFYEWKAYNKFSKDGENIPKGYQKIDIPKKVIQTFLVGSNEKLMNELNKLKNKKHYYTHDNGGRPYLLYILGKNVLVYKNKFENEIEENYDDPSYDFYYEWSHYLGLNTLLYTKLVNKYSPQKIFIGKSPLIPMTKFSGGHGKAFDGNSILLHISKNKYVHIGRTITQFKSFSPIKKFVSPVGNSDVPYPFAIDEDNNYYLIIASIVMKCSTKECREEPYHTYYNKHLITADMAYIPPKEPFIKHFQDIEKFYIGKNQYTLTYSHNGSDYDRLIKDIGSPLSVRKTDGSKLILTKAKYKKLMNDFGKAIGVRHMKYYK